MRPRRPRSRVVAVGGDAGPKPRNTAEAPEIAAVLDTGNRSESNACSAGRRPRISAYLREEAMHGEAESKFEVADQIVAFKRSMAPRREALKRAFGEVKD